MAGELPYETAQDVLKTWCEDNGGTVSYPDGRSTNCRIDDDNLMIFASSIGDLAGVKFDQDGDNGFDVDSQASYMTDTLAGWTPGLQEGEYGMEDAEFDESTDMSGESLMFESDSGQGISFSPN